MDTAQNYMTARARELYTQALTDGGHPTPEDYINSDQMRAYLAEKKRIIS